MDVSQSTRRAFLGSVATLPVLAAAPAGATAMVDPLGLGLLQGMIHLNTASAGPTSERVLARTVEAWRRIEVNPVWMSYSADPDSVVSAADRVRGKAALLVGASADEILLTDGTTSGMTALAHGVRLREGDHVLLTTQEHHGGEAGWLHREGRDGIVVDRVDIPIGDSDTGAILRRFGEAILPRTRVVSVSHVLSPTGLRMPIAEIASLARRAGALCVVDGAQAVGEIAVDMKALGCDAYATSGHKWLMGPKGTGFVYISKDAGDAIAPAQWQFGRRFGSSPTALGPMTLAIGLGEAIDRLLAIGMANVEKHNIGLRNRIHDGVARMPQLRLVSPPPGPLATALIAGALPDSIDSKALLDRMRDRHRIIIKMQEKRWLNGIRLSPHIFNDEAEVDRSLNALGVELEALAKS